MSRKPKTLEEAFENQVIAKQGWYAGWLALLFGLGLIGYALTGAEPNTKGILGIGAMFVVLSGSMLFGSVWLKKRNQLADIPNNSLHSSAKKKAQTTNWRGKSLC